MSIVQKYKNIKVQKSKKNPKVWEIYLNLDSSFSCDFGLILQECKCNLAWARADWSGSTKYVQLSLQLVVIKAR